MPPTIHLGDELQWEGEFFCVIDPAYMGDGPLLENVSTGEEVLMDLDTWIGTWESGAIALSIDDDNEGDDLEDETRSGHDSSNDPTDEVAITCPTCGEISHCLTSTMTAGEAVTIDCSVCCRPMVVRWDGMAAEVSEPG